MKKKHIKNFDTWKLFEAYHDSDDYYERWKEWDYWDDFGTTRYAFISSCEIYAVLFGVDEAIAKFKNLE